MSKNAITEALRHAVEAKRRAVSGMVGSNAFVRITIAEAESAASEIDRLTDALAASEKRVEELEQGIKQAIDYSGNRWSEWGNRAAVCLEYLEAALAARTQEPPDSEHTQAMLDAMGRVLEKETPHAD